MNDKKELTEEELVAIAKQPSVDKPRKIKLNEMEQFISDVGIEASEDIVPGQHIYWVYRNWCRDLGKKPKTNIKFFREFKKHFTIYTMRHGGKCYLVKKEPFELTEQEWWDMKKFYRDFREIRRQRKETKRKRRESGSKETL